ncbi:MAG: hypothetical protein A3F90_12510 [Deltaproteobacteria bacterium RIFCSPLOWO2_12_FULL_60_19]|nr:MAG: hypothetical protein A3F90_12510 [Deltaproteobacteria bacterium RIFCSPLOWO2_12_FULL_60_19]
MITVTVRELKDKLAEYLRRVKAGESILVTERGKTVAVISTTRSAVEEYDRLRAHEAAAAESRFNEALERIHSTVAKAGLKPGVVKEAVRKSRRS